MHGELNGAVLRQSCITIGSELCPGAVASECEKCYKLTNTKCLNMNKKLAVDCLSSKLGICRVVAAPLRARVPIIWTRQHVLPDSRIPRGKL